MFSLALLCLTCVSHSRRVHTSSEKFQHRLAKIQKPNLRAQSQNEPKHSSLVGRLDLLKQLTNILLAYSPDAAFHAFGVGLQMPLSNPTFAAGGLDQHAPMMKVREKFHYTVKPRPLEEVPAENFPAYKQRPYFRFEVLHQSKKSRARVGRIHTPHGVIDTPGFVPVGTNAALKFMTSDQAEDCGVQLQFANTYHLLVHPGTDVVAKAGGLHSFMNRPNFPLITDSGGFQVFSLASTSADDSPELKRRSTEVKGYEPCLLRKNEDGVEFRSYFDCHKIWLTPESSVLAQKALGADIIIPLDELPPNGVSSERLAESVALSHRWEARSLAQHLADPQQQAMYAVVHGGTNRSLRAHSVEYLSSLPFDGYAIGGSLGCNKTELRDLLEYVLPLLPEDKPNHILGIADPESVGALVPLGIDTCDSCFPTRVARHGRLFTRAGNINIKLARYKDDHGPVDPEMPTIPHSRAYLHHLFRMREPAFCSFASMHNIKFMNTLMAEMREKIYNDEI